MLSFIGNAIDKQAFFHGWESFGMSLLIFSTDSLSMLAPTFSHHPADKHCTILPAAGGGCPAASTI